MNCDRQMERHGRPGRRLAYLCLQATRQGQASYAHVHEIIWGLERRGWRVRLLQPSYHEGRLPGPFVRLLWFSLVQIKLWLAERPSAIYIRHHFAALPTAIWARLIRVPVVQEVNGPYEDLFIAWPLTRRFTRLLKWAMKTQLRMADAIVAVTHQLAEWVKKESGNVSVHVVPNGVNVELFRPDAPVSPSSVLPDSFVVFFGALAPWQGIDTMLEAIKCPQWPSEVKLVIMGDGAEREKVQLAAESGRVVYLGVVPYCEVAGIVAGSIASLSPQNNLGRRSETGLFPLKVLESLACEVPVIITDFPGIAELVRENGCGLVIPPDDPVALAEAVRYLYEYPEERRRMGRAGREFVVREHAWDNRAALTDTILTQLIRA